MMSTLFVLVSYFMNGLVQPACGRKPCSKWVLKKFAHEVDC